MRVAKSLTREQVCNLIRQRQGDRSLRAYALELNVSAAYLSDIFLGRREPGPKVLRPFKIRRKRSVTTIYEYSI